MLSNFESRFYALDHALDTTFTDDIWRFNLNNGGIVTIDFNVFNHNFLFVKSFKTQADSGPIEILLVELAKLLWLGMTSGVVKSRANLSCPYETIKMLFYYLWEKELTTLHESDLESFFCFHLSNHLKDTEVIKRISPPCYRHRPILMHIRKLKKILNRYNISILLGTFRESSLNKAMDKACLSMFDMTFNEYKIGGSFNFLGLDIGKHYIDHCNNVFEDHFPLIAAFKSVVDAVDNDIKNKSFSGLTKRSVTRVATQVLAGLSPNGLGQLRINIEKTEQIEKHLHEVFLLSFASSNKLINAFKIDTVNFFVDACGLSDRYDSQEFVRCLFFIDFYGEHGGKTKNKIWQEYEAALNGQGESILLSLVEFEILFKNHLLSLEQELPSTNGQLREYIRNSNTYLSEGLKSEQYPNFHYFRRCINRLAECGATCFLGITGWRRTEFGFSLSDISIESNADVLDNFYTPWRFHIHWPVEKTGGKTKLEREITSNSYILLSQIAQLRDINTNEGLLGNGDFIYAASRRFWVDFVKNYQFFNPNFAFQSDSLKSTVLKLKATLQGELHTYEKSTYTGGFTKMLEKYRDGKLSRKDTKLLERRLSSESLEKLKSDDYLIDHTNIIALKNEFLNDIPYPSPHAFRHIWAEAVLMRYRGDVGRFIRSNFKHMDERFFMAYLRNKDMKLITQTAERAVISLIVQYYMETEEEKFDGYVSKLPRLLDLAVEKTKVLSHEEYMIKLKETVSDRIISIKVHAWGTCIRRVGTGSRAICSVDGVAQTHNAKPEFCFICTNIDITGGNLKGIMVYTKQNVNACLNTSLPKFLKTPHVSIVKDTLSVVRKMKETSKQAEPYDKAILVLEHAIMAYEIQE